MQRENEGPELSPHAADDPADTMNGTAVSASSDLRKRRSTRIVQAVPLNVTGVDALGRPFNERTSTLIINCHGCRYQSKHYVLKNMWVNLEVPHPEPGQSPRRVRGKVAWIQRPRTVRQLFQVALELETAGNAWGIAFPPEDWFAFPPEGESPLGGALSPEIPSALLSATGGDLPAAPGESEVPSGAPDNLRVFPAPASATDASMQLARQVARLLGEAKQQIQAAARESAVQAVSAERRVTFEQWDQKYAAFREEVARETAHAVETIQGESATCARVAHEAAAEALKIELPRWLAPQLEQLTHELTAHLAREGALQRDQHEKQLSSAQDAWQTLCNQAEEAAARLRTTAEVAESQVAERIEATARRAEEEARKREESAGNQHAALTAGMREIQERVTGSLAEAQNSLHEQLARELEPAKASLLGDAEASLREQHQKAAEELQEKARNLHQEILEAGQKQSAAVQAAFEAQSKQLEDTLARANQASERLEQFAGRVEAVQQQAIAGFQSQLDDVLTLHRNELHRQSGNLFEEIHERIQSSFEAANSRALEKFEEQIASLVNPHVCQAEEAVHRLAGGRSLLDAAMTMQQDRIRASADDAFAESMARFRENLGSVEQLLSESAQSITNRNLEELENRTADSKHHALEEMFKSAEWYEKKAQTQLQNITEKLVDQSGTHLREKAAELSSLFATELSQSSQAYIGQTHQKIDETVHDAFERVRLLFAEAADTTSAAFTDEIQRTARQELEGFTALMTKSVELSRERLDTTREEITQRVSAEQEEFLRRFRAGVTGAVEKSLNEAQEEVRTSFASLLESWKTMSEAKRGELRETFGKISDESAAGYRDRLENISNSWMVATVATLDHQSRDVIAKIAATAEERLREASSEVFCRFGDTLRERLRQIAMGFDTGKNPPKS
jgi:hypothetical protein